MSEESYRMRSVHERKGTEMMHQPRNARPAEGKNVVVLRMTPLEIGDTVSWKDVRGKRQFGEITAFHPDAAYARVHWSGWSGWSDYRWVAVHKLRLEGVSN